MKSHRWIMPARLTLVAVCAIALVRAAIADSSSTQPTTAPAIVQISPEIQKLVEDLSSDEFAVRQKAQHELENMGEGALPQLQAVLANQLADEVRTRVGAATRRIVDQQRFGPSVISIHCTDAPLEGVLQDFAHQASADLGVNRPEIRGYLQSHKITLNLEHVDFWTALQEIEDKTSLHVRPDNDGKLILDNTVGFWMGQMADSSLTTFSGPCRISVQSWNIGRTFLRRGANNSNLNLQLIAMIEPKLRVVGGFQPNWVRECVDDKGHSLLSPQMPGGFFGGGPRQILMNLNANLRPVPGMGSEIARLKGELDFDVQTKSEVVTFDNILNAQDVTQKLAGSVLTVKKFARDNNNNQYVLQLEISGPFAAPNSQFIQDAMYSQLQVLDENNLALQQIGFGQNYDSAGHATLTINYLATTMVRNPGFVQQAGAPKKLRCEVTTEVRPMAVPFEIDHISLEIAPPDNKNP